MPSDSKKLPKGTISFVPSPEMAHLLDSLARLGIYGGNSRTAVVRSLLGPRLLEEAARWGITLRPVMRSPEAEEEEEPAEQ